ncbi:TetR/AcrR family transcriptional regulator [Rhizosaccharibacter radicis]|uniref:TetR/AcrR family transcriptional regulator n=1 Tax=Rhizosaccharibacter radicis TaxID=2782605 RepID=A0ABT1VUH2_9PROT|nr:TetR/AcrR family transcriptional regulator [Acetobacteraceae bacterium KSS12]
MQEQSTADRILAEARRLVMARGYNGFSYADIADAVGIRKASIHHHFAAKSDLVRAVVEQARDGFRGHAGQMRDANIGPRDQLRAYVAYWERCILDDTDAFCVAAVLAAELPALPEDVATAVQAHFRDSTGWLARILDDGVAEGTVRLSGAPASEADAFLSAIYGAMLSARAFRDVGRFLDTAALLLSRVMVLR